MENLVQISEKHQALLLAEAEQNCTNKINSISEEERFEVKQKYCQRTWDGFMCWPDVLMGHTAVQSCPTYINLFKTDHFASRQCTSDGEWFVHPSLNQTWTNYTLCVYDYEQSLITRHLPVIKAIYHVGYGLSMISLLIAISILLYHNKLRCPRNILHVHLFMSFILRASLSFLRDLLVGGLGLSKDLQLNGNDVVFRDDVTHWECRLLMVSFNYAMATNYLWIFVEGLYLHNLIFVDVFSESSSVIGYIIFGWISSLVFIIPWIIVRATVENVLCWNTHPTVGYFWIIKLPLVITVLVNFVFFLRILRVLCSKLEASNTTESRKYRHRQLAKSTLVLIPLLGVPYVLFLGLPDRLNETAELVKIYFEMTFNSFNGCVVAFLFCFANGEVQTEIRKTWNGFRESRGWSSVSMRSRRDSQSINNSVTGTTFLPNRPLTPLREITPSSPHDRTPGSASIGSYRTSDWSTETMLTKNSEEVQKLSPDGRHLSQSSGDEIQTKLSTV